MKNHNNWPQVKLENIAKKIIGGGTPSTSKAEYWNGEIAWTTSAHLTGREIQTGQKYITKKGLLESSTCVVPKQNILIATRVGIGKVAINKIDIAISQDLTGILIDKKSVMPEYLYWALTGKKNRLKALAQGSTIKGILRTDVAKIKIPLPALPEQKKIAEILSTVDQTIEKTIESIKKTEKLKNALIQRLLSRGIGHKKFKKTFIGEIPIDWESVRVNDVCEKPEYGYTESAAEKPIGPRFLRISDIHDGIVQWESVPYCQCPDSLKEKYILRSGDILFARTGATTGKSYIIKKCPEAVFASYLIRIVTKEKIDSNFLYLVFNSYIYWKQIAEKISGSAQGGINASSLSNIKIPLPPLHEQKKIAGILGEIDKKLELLHERKRKIERIKKGLMNNLLTGERRVKL